MSRKTKDATLTVNPVFLKRYAKACLLEAERYLNTGTPINEMTKKQIEEYLERCREYLDEISSFESAA